MARINPRKMEYADAMELALYNAVLVGLSLNGKKFSYENPLAVNDASYERKEWFDVSCCPANVSNFVVFTAEYRVTFPPSGFKGDQLRWWVDLRNGRR
jgi:DUF1680 family protein